jgi:signal transduction histidine kinase
VFERYQRGSNVSQIPGEGLGLASVRQLVELHGGQVEVESSEGHGTTFTVRLPLESNVADPSSSQLAMRRGRNE